MKMSFCRLIIGSVLATGTAHAQLPDFSMFQELEQAGYVPMNKVTTPLLYPANTGKPFSLKILLVTGRDDMPKEAHQPLSEASYSRDEFKVHAIVESYRPFVDEKIGAIQHATGLLVPLRFTLGEYEFDRHRFPLKLALTATRAKSAEGLHCAGAYDKFQNLRQTACVSVSNWNEKNSAFQYLAIDDQAEAQRIKQLLQGGRAGFYFVTAKDGPFRLATGSPQRVGNFMDQSIVAGSQPVKVQGLILVDFSTGQILVSGPMPNAAGNKVEKSNPKSASSNSSAPPQSTTPSIAANTTPAGQKPENPVSPDERPNTDVGVEPSSNTTAAASVPNAVTFGVPDDAPTLRLDKLLSMLSYSVYADAEKLATAQRDAAQLESKFDRIQNDAGRDALIKARELKELQPKIEAAGLKVVELQAQISIKKQVELEFGAQPVLDPVLAREAAAGHVYLDRYSLRDGRQVVVFRGTDNSHDVWTDLQIGMTPELAAELLKGIKSASGRGVVTGAGRVSDPASQIAQGGVGRPPAFAVVDNIVRKIIKSGISPDRLILTGHSLGGGYAQFAGLRNKVGQVIAFNPAPLNSRLQKDAMPSSGGGATTMRHYISYVSTKQSRDGTYGDPVSQLTTEYLKQPEIANLKVLGRQYAVPVCVDLRGPEYRAFSRLFQDSIKHVTLGSIDRGFHITKQVGSVLGKAEGMATAGTEQESAIKTGGQVGKVPGKAAATAAYCLKHKVMCTGKVAAGGAASVLAKTDLSPRAWTIFSAHKMKNLEEAILNDGAAQCEDPQTQLGPNI